VVLQFAVFKESELGVMNKFKYPHNLHTYLLSLRFSCKEPAGSWTLKSGEVLEKLCYMAKDATKLST
jgi:hypothetical protein